MKRNEKKESFLLYDSYAGMINMMTDEQAGQLIKAVFAFECGEDIPKLDPALQFAFKLIADRMEKDNAAYNEKCERNSKAAKKREADKKSTNVTNVHERDKRAQKAQTCTNVTNVHERDDCDRYDMNRYDMNRYDMNGYDMNRYDKESIKSATHSPNYQAIVGAYNSVCKDFPQIQKLTDERRKKIKTRLESFSEADLITAFEKISKSDFAKGSNWCSFDWIIKSDANLTKILEGNYDNKDSSQSATSNKTGFSSFEDFQRAVNSGE